MDEWEQLTPAEKEQVLRDELHRTEQKLLEYSAQIAEVYRSYTRLRDELEQITIYGAEEYFSTENDGQLPNYQPHSVYYF